MQGKILKFDGSTIILAIKCNQNNSTLPNSKSIKLQ